jgi:Pseudomonas avirulence D protein (AvrD)
MSAPRAGIRLSFPTVDDCLGPAADRFFGSGYRRVRYTAGDAYFDQARNGATLRARVGVHHRAGWSRKTAGTPAPHLTTVDCVLLGIRAAEICVSRAFGLHHCQRQASWPLRMDIRSAGGPVEDRLDDVRVTTQLSGARRPADHGSGTVSVLDGRVAAMRTRLEMVHEEGTGASTGRSGPLPGHLLGERYPGHYGPVFSDHRQTIRHLVLDLGEGTARAQVELGLAGHRAVHCGETASGRAATMLDGFVTALQLGQALLYETDGISRSDSGTLWMRSTVIRASRPRPAPSTSLGTTATLSDVELVHNRGETWRTAVIEGELQGVTTHCAVAHRLSPAVATRLAAGVAAA